MANKRLRRKRFELECSDEGGVLIPFAFSINGTTTPTLLLGDELLTLSRSAAGKFAMTTRDLGAGRIFGGFCSVSNTGDTDDFVGKVDWSSWNGNGTLTIRTMTGGTAVDPANGVLVGGFLFVKDTNRRARARAQS